METGCTTKAAEAALQSLMGGGQDTGKPVTLPHDASVGKPRDSQEENGSGNGIFCGGEL